MHPSAVSNSEKTSPPADRALGSKRRLDALEGTGLMHSPEELAFDRLTRLASALLAAPVALVSLVDDRRQFFKSAVGLPEPFRQLRETPLSHSLCKHVVTGDRALIIDDTRTHPISRDNPVVPEMQVIAYAGMPIRLSSGLVLGSFCVIDSRPHSWSDQDVAGLRDLAASVTTEIELRLMLAAQADVMGIVSHDLKNPLSSIAMNCDVLEAALARMPQAAGPQMGRAVERLRRASERMTEMVHELLDQARHNQGRIILRMRLNSAQSVAMRAIESVQSLAEAKGVDLVVGENLDQVQLDCDHQRMSQVLVNLLSNAITYTSERSQVAIDAQETEGRVRISVHDQGPGIAEEARGKLFERFWRGPDAPAGGHGIGLHGASRLAEAQGGRLGVESTLGRGSTFFVEVPAPSAPSAPEAATKAR